MAETVGVSKSSVSQEAIQASEEELQRLCARRCDDLDLLVIYLDGLVFGEHHLLAAVGVDTQGCKHVLGLAEGASENQVVAQGLLERLVAQGLDPKRRYLFVIDGSKALRAAHGVGSAGRVFGFDLTSEMLERAQRNAAAGNYANVAFSRSLAAT